MSGKKEKIADYNAMKARIFGADTQSRPRYDRHQTAHNTRPPTAIKPRKEQKSINTSHAKDQNQSYNSSNKYNDYRALKAKIFSNKPSFQPHSHPSHSERRNDRNDNRPHRPMHYHKQTPKYDRNESMQYDESGRAYKNNENTNYKQTSRASHTTKANTNTQKWKVKGAEDSAQNTENPPENDNETYEFKPKHNTCFKCGQSGHFARECQQNKPEQSDLNKYDDTANNIETNDRERHTRDRHKNEKDRMHRSHNRGHQNKGRNGRNKRQPNRDRMRRNERSNNKGKNVCYECGGIGHFSHECPNHKLKQRQAQSPPSHSNKPYNPFLTPRAQKGADEVLNEMKRFNREEAVEDWWKETEKIPEPSAFEKKTAKSNEIQSTLNKKAAVFVPKTTPPKQTTKSKSKSGQDKERINPSEIEHYLATQKAQKLLSQYHIPPPSKPVSEAHCPVIDESVIQKVCDKMAREAWKIGSKVQIFSRSEQKWNVGRVIKLSNALCDGLWSEGNACQIYSKSNKAWINGQIMAITFDESGEWLKVEYDGYHKELLINSSDIKCLRPLDECNGQYLTVFYGKKQKIIGRYDRYVMPLKERKGDSREKALAYLAKEKQRQTSVESAKGTQSANANARWEQQQMSVAQFEREMGLNLMGSAGYAQNVRLRPPLTPDFSQVGLGGVNGANGPNFQFQNVNVTNNVVSHTVVSGVSAAKERPLNDLSDICWEFNEMKGCKKGETCKWRHDYLKGKIEHPYTGQVLDGDKAREHRLKQTAEVVKAKMESKIAEAKNAELDRDIKVSEDRAEMKQETAAKKAETIEKSAVSEVNMQNETESDPKESEQVQP